MRSILLVAIGVLYSSLFSPISAQTELKKSNGCSDTIEISGYYVFVYTKNEINQSVKNKRNKDEGLPYSISIDDEYREFFIPLDKIKNPGDLSRILNSLLKKEKKETYVDYPSLDEYVFDEYGIGCLKSSTASSAWPVFQSSNFYVTSGPKSKYCYKIFSLTAKWIRLKLSKERTYEMLARKAKYLDPSEPNYEVFVLSKLINFSSSPVLSNLPVKLWKKLESFW